MVVSPTDLVRRAAAALAAAIVVAASDSRGRFRPASEDEREVRSGSSSSFMGVRGGAIENVIAEVAVPVPEPEEEEEEAVVVDGNLVRGFEADFDLLPLLAGYADEDGVGGWTNFELWRLDQEVAIMILSIVKR
jgi:hypothetical protein